MRSLLWTAAAGIALLAMGCACGAPGADDDDDDIAGCSDQDGDGYGVGMDCIGSDCDDQNPEVWDEAQCEALCQQDPHSTGCDCNPATDLEPEICYSGPDGTLGVGDCRGGLRTCLPDGRWSPCDGQVVPGTEVCDGVDNDCDNEVDEGVSSACGNCEDVCDEDSVGRGGSGDWDPENEGEPGVVVDEGGALTLDETASARNYLWVPSWSVGMVVKLDAETFEEQSRYYFSPDDSDDPYHMTVSPIMGAAISTGGTYLTCRGWWGGGACENVRITIIDYPPCDDNNGDGVITTSERAGDVLDWGEDDCMRLSVVHDEVPYGAVVWDPRMELDGLVHYIWLADPVNSRLFELDEDAEDTGRVVDTAPLKPAGLEITQDGLLIASDEWPQSNVGRIDTERAEAEVFDNGQGQKHTCIAVDIFGNVWVPNDLGLSVFYPDDNTYVNVLDDVGMRVASYEIATDDEARIWQGGWFNHVFWLFDAETREEQAEIDLGPPASIGGGGWGDTEDYVFPEVSTTGTLFVIDQATSRVLLVDKDDPADFEVVYEDLPTPGTCGDLTGVHRARQFGPNSGYSHVFDGCAADTTTHWTHVLYEADVPAGARIDFSVRVADDIPGLAAVPYEAVGSAPRDGSPISILEALGEELAGGYAELRVVLSAGDLGPPRLLSFGLRHSCQGMID